MKQDYKKIIDENLKKYLKPTEPTILWKSMAYTTLLDGKRLRPILVLETARIFSDDYKIAIPTACALEMLHAQSLIYDDLPCMDNDDLRRSKPANHKVFGEGISLMAGDALISYAAQVIIEHTKLSSDKVLRVISAYLKAAGAYGIVGGQVADMISENKEISKEELNYIHKHKTSTLFEFAINAGCILGGADEYKRCEMLKFASKLGLAFQICDDVLDVISSTEDLGKTAGKDQANKKATYVRLYGLEKSIEDTCYLCDQAYDILHKLEIKSEIMDEILASIKNKVRKK